MHIKQLVFCLVFIALSACKNDNKIVSQTKVAFTKEGELTIHKKTPDTSKINFDIEIADTDFDIQTGLMYRTSMAQNQGMLFVFNDETERYFYMKNTKIPLDIIYVNAAKTIVSIQKNAKPFDETSLPSKAPAKYVLEINAGLSKSLNINVGDSLSF